MENFKFVCWQDGAWWLGYLQDYPDYWTQGGSLDDLKDQLRGLLEDIDSGELQGIRRVEELVIP